jgi:hypothetical protein
VIAAIALLLATAFPAQSRTAWMRPESFRLTIGMPRDTALKTLEPFKPHGSGEEVVVDYSDSQSVTLQFRRERLHAIRFEYFAFIPDAKSAFEEEKAFLRTTFGEPKKATAAKSVVIYDDRLPNVMAVLSASPESENGRKGIGMLVVRYYDPVVR